MQVYRIYNKINGKCYIGITKMNFFKRYSNGKWWKTTHSCHLKKAVCKYGLENFDYEILFNNENENIYDLIELEKIYIKQYNSLVPNGYNLTAGGSSEDSSFAKEYSLVDCYGNIYDIVNLSEFCFKNKLNYSAMLNMVSGRHPVSQGFALSGYDGEIPNKNKKIILENIYTNEISYFLDKDSSKWAKSKNLNIKSVRLLINKKILVHENWKLLETKSDEIKKHNIKKPIKLKKNGEIIIVESIYEFCKINNYSRNSFYKLIKGISLEAYGFSLAQLSKEELRSLKHNRLGKEIVLISPENEEVRIKNISEFCRKNKINKSGIYALIKERIKEYKKWKLKK